MLVLTHAETLAQQTDVCVGVGSCSADHLVEVMDEPTQPAQMSSGTCGGVGGRQLRLLAAFLAARHASLSGDAASQPASSIEQATFLAGVIQFKPPLLFAL